MPAGGASAAGRLAPPRLLFAYSRLRGMLGWIGANRAPIASRQPCPHRETARNGAPRPSRAGAGRLALPADGARSGDRDLPSPGDRFRTTQPAPVHRHQHAVTQSGRVTPCIPVKRPRLGRRALGVGVGGSSRKPSTSDPGRIRSTISASRSKLASVLTMTSPRCVRQASGRSSGGSAGTRRKIGRSAQEPNQQRAEITGGRSVGPCRKRRAP
jgi:hypothetical protein